jgi:hypothetical protein
MEGDHMRTITGSRHHSQKKHNIYRLVGLFAFLWLVFYPGCAQVPKQSVELSATLGRDISEVYRAHRELALILYGRVKGDVNKFVDEVYAPYQISKLLQADHEDFKKGDANSLFFTLDAAVRHPNDPNVQKSAMEAMDVFVQVLREEIESYREKRLAPVLAQEKELLSAIDRSYNQIHYANSIVTGHLASIVQVHDAQEELLSEFGIEGLREGIGRKLSNTSNKVAELVGKARKLEGTVLEMEAKIKELTKKLDAAVGVPDR